ncbi:hypothetical protein [Fusobacterium sp.]|uniref:hypothetical protein n=1 Tax=Fusobacterium sp. TaxID=68766 RepID=UPI00261FB29E|nr:hypothetical protein [Fusobacterium sp.]
MNLIKEDKKIFTKKSDTNTIEDIIFFPSAVQVFDDPSLECYFKPLLSVKKYILGKEYVVHLLSTDGVFSEKIFLNSERYFWGFKYINGKYHFLGNINSFGNSNFTELYSALKKDFSLNKETYFKNKVNYKEYYNQNKNFIKNIARFTKEQDPQYFSEAFYCYEFTKYYFEKTGKFCNINEIFENPSYDENEVLLSIEDVGYCIEEFFLNLKYNLENKYNISPDMAVCGAESFKFTCWGATSIAFVNVEDDNIYILECHN